MSRSSYVSSRAWRSGGLGEVYSVFPPLNQHFTNAPASHGRRGEFKVLG